MVIREKITAGAVTFVRVMQNRKALRKQKRKKKENPSSESVIRNNRKNAIRDLSIKLNHNFSHGDYHVMLTYGGAEPTREFAKKSLDKFKRKLKGKKWICVTEYEHKRIHHHIVVSGVTIEEINKLWTHGYTKISVLDRSGDYRKLAEYLVKETDQTFRTPGAFSKRRYNCSRAIKNPPVYTEEVKRLELEMDPVVLKGTQLDENSVYRGENPFTGEIYLEYVLVAIDPQKKRRLKGKKKEYVRDSQYERWLREHDQMSIEFEKEMRRRWKI